MMCSTKLSKNDSQSGLPVLEAETEITPHQFSHISCSHLHFNEGIVLLGFYF